MKPNSVIAALLLAMLISIEAYAADTGAPGQGGEAQGRPASETVCETIARAIRDGVDEGEVTKTTVELGHSSCLAIKCAIESGGEPRKVVLGAMQASVSVDVISRCATLGGADASTVADAINEGADDIILCYVPPIYDLASDIDFSNTDKFRAPYEPVSPMTFH